MSNPFASLYLSIIQDLKSPEIAPELNFPKAVIVLFMAVAKENLPNPYFCTVLNKTF